MSDFSLYFQLGISHISDLKGYDHILFIVALCAAYAFSEWRKVLILVTAFTIGHSLTLALSTLRYLVVPSAIIEFLIPVTILFTALSNVIQKQDRPGNKSILNYALALFFGLIHGMGFSNYLRQLMGMEDNIFVPLLAFNLGLELGQVLIVGAFALLSFFILSLFKYPHREWKIFVSGAAAGISLILMSQTKFW